jgi:enterochelin esterase-like enzyme
MRPRRWKWLAAGMMGAAAVGFVGVVLVNLGASHATAGPTGNVAAITIHSTALGRNMPALVFTPASFDPARRYPVLYLFHGRGGDETSWMGGRLGQDGVGVDSIAQRLITEGGIPPLIIVSARIDDSYGVDSPPSDEGYAHGPYEQYIVDELVPAIEARYPARTDAAGRFIGGLSMGGFAALHAAFRHPDLFGGVAGLSPAVWQGDIEDRLWLYPDAAARDANDPLHLVRTAPIDGMRVFLGAGDRDYSWILDATAVLTERLNARGMPVTPLIVPGVHDASTWRQLAPAMLEALVR